MMWDVERGTIHFLPFTANLDGSEEMFGFSRRNSGGLTVSSRGLGGSSGGLAEEK